MAVLSYSHIKYMNDTSKESIEAIWFFFLQHKTNAIQNQFQIKSNPNQFFKQEL